MLSTETVVAAGVDSVREWGLPALSLRSLSDRLGVTPMALYRHVKTADALQSAVVGAIVSQVPPVSVGTWTDVARAWAGGARDVLSDHPGVARHALTHWFEMPAVMDWIEGLLAAAEAEGMRGPLGVAAVNAVFMYVLMRAEAEETVRTAGVVRRRLPRGARSKARWPRIHASAGEYEVARLDVHFAFGLDVVLHGVERRKHARP